MKEKILVKFMDHSVTEQGFNRYVFMSRNRIDYIWETKSSISKSHKIGHVLKIACTIDEHYPNIRVTYIKKVQIIKKDISSELDNLADYTFCLKRAYEELDQKKLQKFDRKITDLLESLELV